jgi:DNA-binding LacI/PurR family transcriptional regulator
VKPRVTSQDVARRAGVSQSAVSRVFSGASASKATIAKVRAAAAELGYRPNVLARSLITGRSRIVGLVVAHLDNQFYPDALARLSEALQARGYHILVFLAADAGAGTEAVIEELLDHQVDGIVLASVSMSDDLAARCEAAGIPVVLFNRGQDDARLSEVTSDNFAGAARVAAFLAAGGHRRIAHVAGWLGASTGRDRLAGFRAGLAEAGCDLLGVEAGNYRRDAAADAAERLLERVGPDALFVGNDHMAFAVLDRLRHDMGLRVPGDVSVVGYDDVPMAAWPAYGLTTVCQPSGRMVECAVEVLLGRIENPGRPPQRIALEGELIVRGSARVPPGPE